MYAPWRGAPAELIDGSNCASQNAPSMQPQHAQTDALIEGIAAARNHVIEGWMPLAEGLQEWRRSNGFPQLAPNAATVCCAASGLSRAADAALERAARGNSDP
jgi:hypothetical protein